MVQATKVVPFCNVLNVLDSGDNMIDLKLASLMSSKLYKKEQPLSSVRQFAKVNMQQSCLIC